MTLNFDALPISLSAYFQRNNSDLDLPEVLSPLQESLYSVETLTISGVYFLLREDEVVYVGQSNNVAQRVATGHADKDFDDAVCILVPKDQLLVVETAFISALNPEYNQTNSLPKHRNTSVRTAHTLEVLEKYGWEIEY